MMISSNFSAAKGIQDVMLSKKFPISWSRPWPSFGITPPYCRYGTRLPPGARHEPPLPALFPVRAVVVQRLDHGHAVDGVDVQQRRCRLHHPGTDVLRGLHEIPGVLHQLVVARAVRAGLPIGLVEGLGVVVVALQRRQLLDFDRSPWTRRVADQAGQRAG